MNVHWITDERVERVAQAMFAKKVEPETWASLLEDSRADWRLDARAALTAIEPDLAALHARIAELEAALQPFAQYGTTDFECSSDMVVAAEETPWPITVGHFRNAAYALRYT